MKIDQDEPVALEEEEEEEEEEEQDQHLGGPSHNPSAPSDEVFDVSTTVDPSYVIFLIRKLIPGNVPREQSSNPDSSEEGLVSSSSMNGAMRSSESANMDCIEQPGHDETSIVGEEAWEEYGCVLWDLAATKTHAELMVENLLLEVLVANLTVQQSVRAIEISLGIIGNLACHGAPMKRILSANRLIELIINQLFLDDSQCLCEACRLLSSGLRSSESLPWAVALQPEHVLSRILWIAENSLNPQLIEKSVELLLDIIESSEEVVSNVLPSLMNMGLASVLISLLDYEISNLTTERIPERLPILDIILRAVEAISIVDGPPQEISTNKKLFQLVCELVKIPDKPEVSNSCVTAAVLIANILSDEADFSKEISSEARSAIWSILSRLLVQVNQNETSPGTLGRYVSVLASKSDLIEDDLLDRQLDGLKSKARTTALSRIINILNHWVVAKTDSENTDIDTGRLLDCCRRHIESQN